MKDLLIYNVEMLSKLECFLHNKMNNQQVYQKIQETKTLIDEHLRLIQNARPEISDQYIKRHYLMIMWQVNSLLYFFLRQCLVLDNDLGTATSPC